jgi:23S rRNA (adenine2030-N6)-methyltransferase
MNYRHAYHAGNFADCFKHALLIMLVEYLARKPAAFFALDTHAGIGRYDLGSEEAVRTGEADQGIRVLLNQPTAILRPYLKMVETLGLYPGSPLLIRALLRPADRLCCCELHPEDAYLLRRLFHGDRQVMVHERSGWEALRALLPPVEKRGLVFVDPPFEDRDEFGVLAGSLGQAHRRFANGIFAAWYPVKGLAPVRDFFADIRARQIRDTIAVELFIRAPLDPGRLNGCGLLVINPPYQFEERARQLGQAIIDSLGKNEDGSMITIHRLASE